MIRYTRCLALLLGTVLAASSAIASDLEDRLERELRGAWGILEAEVYSACGGTYSDCSSLLSASYTAYHKNAPKDQPRRWRDGWDDGQELVFNVLIANRLQGCFVPVPPIAAP